MSVRYTNKYTTNGFAVDRKHKSKYLILLNCIITKSVLVTEGPQSIVTKFLSLRHRFPN